MTTSRTVERRRTITFVLVGLAIAIALAVVVAPRASSSPDGLERVAADEGFAAAADDHRFAEGPLAEYGVDGLDNETAATGVSGVVGVLITFAIGLGLFAGLRLWRRIGSRTRNPAPAES